MFENTIVRYVGPMVDKLPSLDLGGIFSKPGVQSVIDILSVISYFFPWDTVLAIVAIICAFQTIRIIVAFLKALWGILPIV